MTKKNHRKRNKAIVIISKTLGTGVIICTILLLLALTLPRLLGFDTYNVLTGSMEPEISVGSLILVKYRNPEEIKVGDVIAYSHNDVVVCHRIIENNISSGKLTTKGDANDNPDPVVVDYSNVIGLVEYHIPTLGLIGTYISSLSGKLLVVEILVVASLLNIIADRLK